MRTSRIFAAAATRRRSLSFLPALSALALAAACSLLAAPAAQADNGDQSGDLVVFGGQHEVVRADQEVKGDLVVIGGSADVLGKVDGDAVALGGKIYIAPQGHVNGSLVNVGGAIDNESSTPQGHGAVPPIVPNVTPEPDQTEAPVVPVAPEERSSPFGGWTTFFIVDGLLAFFAFLLFPTRTASVTEHLVDNPVLAGMLGFFSPIIFVLVIIALAITLVGIPLMPLAVLATIAGYLLGKAAIAQFIGNRINDIAKTAQPRPVAAVAIGLAILFVISALTGWIGIVLYFSIAALAIGAALYMLMRTAEAYRSRRSAVTPPSSTFPVPSAPAQPAPPADPSATQPRL